MSKHIKSVAELRKIRDVAKGVLAIPSSESLTIHMPACRIIDKTVSRDGAGAIAGDLYWYASMSDAARASPLPLASCPECNPYLDGKMNALNRSGTFLHAEICRMVKSLGYHMATEYPVRVAPFVQDPLKRPRALNMDHPDFPGPITITDEFQRALAESQQSGPAQQRVLDIVASATVVPPLELIFPIEVKKADPNYVDWAFMNYNTDKTSMTATVISPKDVGGPMLFSIPFSDLECPPFHVGRPAIRTPEESISIYDGAVPLTLKKAAEYKFQNRSLNNAATQIVEGTFGLITDKILHRVSTGIRRSFTQFYIPVVVTTANLYSCNYNSDDFEISTGLASNASLKKEEFLIYECPTPTTAAFPHQLTYLDRQKNVRPLTKWQVIIAQAQSFEKMLKVIRQAVLDNSRMFYD